MADMQWQKFVRYSCPHCRAPLAWDVGTWRGWALCPSCGQSGNPPRPRLALSTSSASQPAPITPKPEANKFDGSALDDDRPKWTRELDEVRRRAVSDARTSSIRTAAGIGVASALFVMLVGYLDQNSTVSTTAGAAALVLFLVHMRLGRR